MDATTPRGDGLPERVLTDAALWADLRPADRAGSGNSGAGDAAGRDATNDGGAAGRDATDDRDEVSAPCRLLEVSCPAGQACYPVPFEGGPPSGQTACYQDIGLGPALCQSQLDCDGRNICVTPGQADAACRQRCDLSGPNCPPGTACLPLAGYPGVGTCTL